MSGGEDPVSPPYMGISTCAGDADNGSKRTNTLAAAASPYVEQETRLNDIQINGYSKMCQEKKKQVPVTSAYTEICAKHICIFVRETS